MPNLIDSSYFIRDINLPYEGSATQIIEQDIPLYEGEYLRKVLGVAFADLFIANQTDQRFIDLKNGKSYGTEYYWQGLVNTTMKTSPIANYVYYNHVRNNAQKLGASGAYVSKSENATMVSPVDKLSLAWQGMAKMNWDMYDYLVANADVYPEFNINQWWGTNPIPPSLYHRLRGARYGVNEMYNPSFVSRVW